LRHGTRTGTTARPRWTGNLRRKMLGSNSRGYIRSFKIFRVLGTTDEPVTVGKRDAEHSFSIPKPSKKEEDTKGFSLNEALIKIREEETRQVKGVLENIFVDQEEDGIGLPDASEQSAVANNPLAELDEVHQSFFNILLTQETWEKSVLHDTCKEMGLMGRWRFLTSGLSRMPMHLLSMMANQFI
ncbi:MAG: tellurite resistance TerB C-terminal domain-containing protein, partial [Pontiella sp.]